MIKITKEVSRTLWAGCKLVSFGHVDRHAIRGTPADVATLCLLLLAVTVIHELILSEGHLRFYEYGLSYFFGAVALAFGAIGLFFDRLLQDRFCPFVAAVTSASIVALAVAAPIYFALKPIYGAPFSGTDGGALSDWIWFTVIVTLLVACARGYVRAARVFLNDRVRRPWLVGLGAFALTMVADLSLPQLPIFYDTSNPPSGDSLIGWFGDRFETSRPAQTSQAESPARINIERTYYRQSQLIERQGPVVAAAAYGRQRPVLYRVCRLGRPRCVYA